MPEMLWKNYIDFEIDEGEGTQLHEMNEKIATLKSGLDPASAPKVGNIQNCF